MDLLQTERSVQPRNATLRQVSTTPADPAEPEHAALMLPVFP